MKNKLLGFVLVSMIGFGMISTATATSCSHRCHFICDHFGTKHSTFNIKEKECSCIVGRLITKEFTLPNPNIRDKHGKVVTNMGECDMAEEDMKL